MRFEQGREYRRLSVEVQYKHFPMHNLLAQHTDDDTAHQHHPTPPHTTHSPSPHHHHTHAHTHAPPIAHKLASNHVPTPPAVNPHYSYVDTNLTHQSFAILN